MMKKLLLLTFSLLLGVLQSFGQNANTVTYDFTDGTIITNKQSADGKLTLGGEYVYHGTSYGLDLKVDQEINIFVDGSCTISFLGSQYSSLNMVGTAATSGDLGVKFTQVENDKVDTYKFVYSGGAATLNFKTALTENGGSDTYLPSIQVIPTEIPNGLPDVWDFGATQLDDTKYNNRLTEDDINAWYPGVTAGTEGENVPATFTNGRLTWIGQAGKDRLRSSNTNLTRYDSDAKSDVYSGRFYLNTSGSSRYFSIELDEGNELTIYASSSADQGVIHFANASEDEAQDDVLLLAKEGESVSEVKVIANTTGTYHIYGDGAKPSYYRIIRKDAPTIKLTGNVDVSQATDIPSGYSIKFTDLEDKSWEASITDGVYQIELAIGTTYTASLVNADGYEISNGKTVDVNENTTSHDITIIVIPNGLPDVWDFGATQLDDTKYNNRLTEDDINAWYPGVTAGTEGENVPATFTNGRLTWIGQAGKDRLRSSNTNLTRYDSDAKSDVYSGRFYLNTSGSSRYFSIELDEGNELTIYASSSSDQGKIHFANASEDEAQDDVLLLAKEGESVSVVKVIAKTTGTYHIYGDGAKPSYYRIVRKDAPTIELTGNVDVTAASNIPSDFAIKFMNAEGKTWETTVIDGTYQIELAIDATYAISLVNADGFEIVGNSLLSIDENTTTLDITIIATPNGLPDVWDFGAAQLDAANYNNILTEDAINAWYEGVDPGTEGAKIPDTFTNGVLSWIGQADKDRLRTSNTNLTRYDSDAKSDEYTGRFYVNSSSTSRYFSIELNEGDELTIFASSSSDQGEIHFANASETEDQDDVLQLAKEGESVSEVKVIAKKTGTYHIYGDGAKPSYYRMIRSDAPSIELTGNVDAPSDISAIYSIQFTNEDGKSWETFVTNGTYQINLPIGYTYNVSLNNADEYAITTDTLLSVDENTTTLNITILNKKDLPVSLPNVWDFGAEQLDETLYINMLNEDAINAWYSSDIEVGSSGNNIPDFTSGILSWTGKPTSDRLRTTNTNLTRYDENTSGVEGFTGRIYVNGGGVRTRFISLDLDEDDEVTLFGISQNGNGNFHFEYVDNPSVQNDEMAVGADITEIKWVAKKAGTYEIYDAVDKPSYYRVIRTPATYVSLKGDVDTSLAENIPTGYTLVFTNEAGKSWETSPSGGKYLIDLPAGYSYEMSVNNANGFIITSETNVSLGETTTIHNIIIQEVDLYEVSGSIQGLGTDIANLDLIYTVDSGAETSFVPEPEIDFENSTYTVQLESNVEYTISATGVNDYTIPANTITILNSDTTVNVVFEEKATFAVTIETPGLDIEQQGKLSITFSNLNETDYSYTFDDITVVSLRDGVYAITVDGLDEYPIELALTSNLEIAGAIATKTLNFNPVKNWAFNDKVITSSTAFYKGLSFTGTAGAIKNEIAKGHLSCAAGGEINVPLQPGEKMIVTYYYAADFSIDGGTAITTSSGSTSQLETVEYSYTGITAGTAVITINTTSYITNIAVVTVVDYTPELRVGVDKDFQTINGALNAIAQMDRPNNERVTVLIDAGNYEEMVVINNPNITLKNDSQEPSIALKNNGVDIDDNAVRITAYYGYGYNYFSQGTDNKWSAESLEVNKANGYQEYTNVSGTTNASYWNATLVVSSDGFIAEDIIIENSFNQYISQKESEDVLVLVSGNKGVRPTNYGNTDVQNRSFVERGAAIGVANGTDKVILDKCLVVGRQDTFYGGSDSRLVAYKGAMMGAVDYIFGGMTAVFYKTDFVLNTSDTSGDAAYITAAQQGSGRGFLMYECNIISTVPGVNTASTQGAKPGFFGRPWQPTTSEVVFYNTNIDVSTYTGYAGKSLIDPEGWKNSLGGESAFMYEFGTIESSGENNLGNRASWSTVLAAPTLTDGTEITTFNFTKGNDDWDPIPSLIENEDSDNDGILDSVDNCINTYNPDQEDFDNDGIGDVCDDSDLDGLVDSEDNCPNSAEGVTIDVFGCEVFELGAESFSLVATSASCNGGGDGSININALNTDYTYNVSVVGPNTNETGTLSSSNAFTLDITGLNPGTYEVCITIEGKDNFEQCYNVIIEGPAPLDTFASIDKTNKQITLKLDGAPLYYINHNGNLTTTSNSIVVIDLVTGKNTVEVTTDSSCQGKYFEEIFVSEEVVVYPNPTKGYLQVYVEGIDTSVDVMLFDLKGNQYISVTKSVPSNRVIELDLTNLNTGVYSLSLNSETIRQSIKIIKE